MDFPPSSLDLSARARELLALSRRDKRAAEEALAGLSLDQQVAIVCEAPAAQRSRLLDLLPEPETVVPLIPEAELVFTIKGSGLDDASWLLDHATSSQLATCFDLDAWKGLQPDRDQLVHWFDVLAEAEEETLIKAAQAIDPEMLSLYLRELVYVMLDPKDDDWEPPTGSQTIEGQFYFMARNEGDDIAALRTLVDALFREDYWLYFRMMQSVMWELDSELEEYALRWRSGRIEDLGFPNWEEAMRIYGFLRPERRALLAERPLEHGATAWDFPVWIPDLPALGGGERALFRAAYELDESGRRAFFYSFVSLANKVAVADRMALGDVETLPRAVEKAAEIASAGLEYIASETKVPACDVIRRSSLEYLFRVGASLDPDAARPAWLAEAQAADVEGSEESEEPEGF